MVELKVFISHRDSTCSECKRELGRKAWITVSGENAYCLECSDLDHLVFLASGNAALTRRSKKYSNIYAVVLKWSRNRKRYERQGLLVEESAVEKAEEECLGDAEYREIKNQRRREKEAVLDKKYIEKFGRELKKLYPRCPKKTTIKIAEHACVKHSGRVGRSSFAKQFDPAALKLAATAYVRHNETDYDTLLMKGNERWEARRMVNHQIDKILESWAGEEKE